MASHVYLVTRSMQDEYFYNGDAEMLVVLQQGGLRFWTEFGIIDATPGEIVVLPRGVKIRVELRGDEPARGYLCENYGGAFTLPDRGPIGANCLANSRDFLTPVAAYEERDTESRLFVKWGGAMWCCDLSHSPLDVVAWHGNYAPYKYDLRRFSPVGPLLFDHADPSIFTTLTSPSESPGTANVDFVLFPDRWLVSEDTFRPPWYHMNVMSEFMGLIYGVYDGQHGRPEAAATPRNVGVHVRDPLSAAGDPVRRRVTATAKGLRRLLGRTAGAVRSPRRPGVGFIERWVFQPLGPMTSRLAAGVRSQRIPRGRPR
jgi:homogentisate 1,2-dioxygenase